MSYGWIGFDLDGTIAEYDGWRGEEHIGPPIPGMVDRVKKYLDEGWTVKIVTARASREAESDELKAVQKAVAEWSKKHFGVELEVTCEKNYGMVKLYDDRCVQVETNTGMTTEEAIVRHLRNMAEYARENPESTIGYDPDKVLEAAATAIEKRQWRKNEDHRSGTVV